MLSRRQFLQLVGATFVYAVDPTVANPLIPLPPSLMLHSRHACADFLRPLVRGLEREGFTTVTYQGWLNAVLTNASLPTKPVIITMDDLGVEVGNPSWGYFVDFHDYFYEHGLVAVYGIITRPHLPQVAERWATIAGWAGFELATHTAYHSNFNQDNGTARVDFRQADYDAEIVDSARMIAERTGCVVQTLILPYGSGFYRRDQTLHAGIVTSCQTAGIRFAVGIVDGRTPTTLAALQTPSTVIYSGRTTPGEQDTAESALYSLNQWYERVYRAAFKMALT